MNLLSSENNPAARAGYGYRQEGADSDHEAGEVGGHVFITARELHPCHGAALGS
jgi:hypothetical protein